MSKSSSSEHMTDEQVADAISRDTRSLLLQGMSREDYRSRVLERRAIRKESRARLEARRRASCCVAAVAVIVLLAVAVGCADVPTAPTPPAAVSLDAPATLAPPIAGTSQSSAAHPTLTLTVTPDGDRDRVRASIGGIVGVSFLSWRG